MFLQILVTNFEKNNRCVRSFLLVNSVERKKNCLSISLFFPYMFFFLWFSIYNMKLGVFFYYFLNFDPLSRLHNYFFYIKWNGHLTRLASLLMSVSNHYNFILFYEDCGNKQIVVVVVETENLSHC